MGDDSDLPDYTAPEAFQALADPTRLDIVRAIGDAGAEDGTAASIPFSELRDEVGVRDSGRFSYHLEKLQGSLVEDGDDGYGLTYAGYTIYRTLTRGLFESHDALDPVETDLDCPDCGANVSVSHRGDGIVDVACESCGKDYVHYQFPPRGVEVRADAPDDLVMAVDAWARHRISLFGRGVCPSCGGPVESTLTTDRTEVSDRMNDEEAFVKYVCGECGSSPSLTVGITVLDHPAVAGFLYEHGVDYRDRPFLTLLSDASVEVHSVDPPRVAVEFHADDETLVVRIGEDGEVTDVERRREATA